MNKLNLHFSENLNDFFMMLADEVIIGLKNYAAVQERILGM